MLDTLFGTILFQRKQEGTDLSGDPLHDLKADLKDVLSKHGFEFENYEFLTLPSEHFPIEQCERCSMLTSGFDLTELENTAVIDRAIQEKLKQGSITNGSIRCSECEAT